MGTDDLKAGITPSDLITPRRNDCDHDIEPDRPTLGTQTEHSADQIGFLFSRIFHRRVVLFISKTDYRTNSDATGEGLDRPRIMRTSRPPTIETRHHGEINDTHSRRLGATPDAHDAHRRPLATGPERLQPASNTSWLPRRPPLTRSTLEPRARRA